MKIRLLLAGLVCLASALFAQAKWTFMIYKDGDCDLEEYAIDDFLELATVGSNADVNIVVQMDRIPGYSTEYGDWTDCRRGRVQFNDTPTASWGTLIGEVNMGDDLTLQQFVAWGVTTYPADRYAVVLWNHGGGWRLPPGLRDSAPVRDVCWDDTSGDYLSNAEVAIALTAAGTHLDLIGFDACLMGMIEIAYQLRANGDVMVGSEEVEPVAGWPYNTILTDLKALPTMTAAQLGDKIVTKYGVSQPDYTLAAVDLTLIAPLTADVSALAAVIIAADTDWDVIDAARNTAAYFTYPENRDLGTFLDEVAANARDAGIVNAAVTALASYNDAVLTNFSGSGYNATGLATYFIANGSAVNADYSYPRIEYARDSQWDEFLDGFAVADTSADMSGYTLIYSTEFPVGTPVGWTIMNPSTHAWKPTTTSAFNSLYTFMPPYMQGWFMIVDSRAAGSVDMDESLVSPGIDCSGYAEVVLAFDHFFRVYEMEIASVEVRVGTGAWQPARQFTRNDGSVAGHVYADITAIAAGHAGVSVRWHYYNANWEYYWCVDNVRFYGVPQSSLVLTVPDDMFENDGVRTGTVSMDETRLTPVTVYMASNMINLEPEATVIIPAGGLSADFYITVVNNTDKRANFTVELTATTADLDPGTATVTVWDEDTDGDSLGDDWEQFYFDDLGHDGVTDDDGDLFDNAAEYSAGTNPMNPASYPGVPVNMGGGGGTKGCMAAPSAAVLPALFLAWAGLALIGMGRKGRAPAVGRRG
ncbi:MAG: clostripain-related cysteine peptidase [Planctomycetota bacterium]